MKLLAFVLLILGIFKVSLAINLKVSDLEELSDIYGIDPREMYKYLYGFLVIDGLISIKAGLIILFSNGY